MNMWEICSTNAILCKPFLTVKLEGRIYDLSYNIVALPKVLIYSVMIKKIYIFHKIIIACFSKKSTKKIPVRIID